MKQAETSYYALTLRLEGGRSSTSNVWNVNMGITDQECSMSNFRCSDAVTLRTLQGLACSARLFHGLFACGHVVTADRFQTVTNAWQIAV